MKTFRLIEMALVAVFMCVNFASCSSDDDPTEEKDENEVVVSGKKISKIVTKTEDDTETVTFKYDNQGRVTEVIEAYEEKDGNYIYTFKFTWGDDVVKVNENYDNGFYTDSYILTLKNGLVQSSDNNETFTYNSSNRFIKGQGEWSTTTAIWDGDKLVSVTEGDMDEATLTYGGNSCKKGYFPFIGSIIDFTCDYLFIAHPEIAGMRTTQLPTSVTWNYGYEEEKSTLSYEFDKEGYISKIIGKETDSDDGSTETYTYILTWQ